MIARAKRSWRHFKKSKPGDRFQVRYYYRKQSSSRVSTLSRIFNIVAGSVLVIFSAFFGWAPGPGILTLILGLALIGGEFLAIARLLDWAEVRLRDHAYLAGNVWNSSPLGKALIVLAVLILVGVIGSVILILLF